MTNIIKTTPHYSTLAKRVAQTRKNRAYKFMKHKVDWNYLQEHLGTYVCDGKGECSVLAKKIQYEHIRMLAAEGYKLRPNPDIKGQIIIQWD